MAKEIEVIVTETGSARFIYHDDLAELIPPGYTCPIRRASNVEPNEDGSWRADMRPALSLMSFEQMQAAGVDVWTGAGGQRFVAAAPFGQPDPLILGPFATRQEALDAEVAWLKRWAGV